MNYTLSKLIKILETIIKNNSLLDDDNFYIIDKLCSNLDNVIHKLKEEK